MSTTTLGLVEDKVLILVGTLLVTLLFGLIPKKLVSPKTRPSPAWKKAISLMNCFSGGVFLAACLLDLFPEARENIDHALAQIEAENHAKVTYPVAEFIIAVGFFIVLIIEQVVLDCQEGGEDSSAAVATEEDEVPGTADGHLHHHDHVFEHSILRSILLLVALSFHSVFEGLAIGLQGSVGDLVSLFVAVILHKAIMAFSLGLNMAQSALSLRAFCVSVLVFSAASPVGIGVGIALTDLEKSLPRDVANGVLQGLSCGTFLYITFFEVLQQELRSPQNRMLRLLAVLGGYACICGLLFLTA